jgi:hypothetical protein
MLIIIKYYYYCFNGSPKYRSPNIIIIDVIIIHDNQPSRAIIIDNQPSRQSTDQVLAIELQRVSPQLNHVALAAIRHRVLRIMKKKTSLTAVLLIRPKTSTMSSIS